MSDKDFYTTFENVHRGSRQDIKKRLLNYLPFIQALKNESATHRALDLGCGRGEFLELLQENNFKSKGVDLDEGMIEICKTYHLDVHLGDAIKYLTTQADNSITIISAFHIIEHISFDQLQKLLDEAVRVLTPSGILILETPNPENIKVATENFYLDPTHTKPIPSNLLLFLTQFHGFARTKILRLQESKTLVKKQKITLGDVIAGVSPDYAVISQKKSDSKSIGLLDYEFTQDYGISLTTLLDKFEHRLIAIEDNFLKDTQNIEMEAANQKTQEYWEKMNLAEKKLKQTEHKAFLDIEAANQKTQEYWEKMNLAEKKLKQTEHKAFLDIEAANQKTQEYWEKMNLAEKKLKQIEHKAFLDIENLNSKLEELEKNEILNQKKLEGYEISNSKNIFQKIFNKIKG